MFQPVRRGNLHASSRAVGEKRLKNMTKVCLNVHNKTSAVKAVAAATAAARKNPTGNSPIFPPLVVRSWKWVDSTSLSATNKLKAPFSFAVVFFASPLYRHHLKSSSHFCHHVNAIERVHNQLNEYRKCSRHFSIRRLGATHFCLSRKINFSLFALFPFARCRFDVLVNGGGAVTLQFQRSPFHPLTRTVFVPWNQVNSHSNS